MNYCTKTLTLTGLLSGQGKLIKRITRIIRSPGIREIRVKVFSVPTVSPWLILDSSRKHLGLKGRCLSAPAVGRNSRRPPEPIP